MVITVSLVLVIGLWTWWVEIEFSKKPFTTQQVVDVQFDQLENITGELYTSPFGVWDAYKKKLDTTSGRVYLQTYDFTEKKMKIALRDLADEWVDIRMIIENHKYKQYKDTFTSIGNYFSGYENVQLKSDQHMRTKYVHSKITLLDTYFWIQTANLTHSSFFKNREHFFVSQHTWMLESLERVFEKDRNWEKILVEDLHPNLVVCNINCRAVVEQLLSSAIDSIVIETQYITDDNVWGILDEKVKSDLDVKLLVSKTDSNNDLLKYFWPLIARTLKNPYVHTKMILIDNKILLLGSMNLSDNSLDNNREIGILLINQQLIQNFLRQFNKDWGNSGSLW